MTRSRQVRSLKKLSRILAYFDELGLERVDNKQLVNAFFTSHSRAEVYRAEDIERLFGPLDGLPAPAASSIAKRMGAELARNWRDPNVQKRAGTRRTTKQIEEGVERGYHLALAIFTSTFIIGYSIFCGSITLSSRILVNAYFISRRYNITIPERVTRVLRLAR